MQILPGDTFGDDAGAMLLALLFASVVGGRLLLALLPPGSPGGHGLRQLPATISASAMLCAGLLLTYLLSWPEALLWPYLALPLLALAGWLVGPGGMLPRHELAPPALRVRDGAAALVLLSVLLCMFVELRHDSWTWLAWACVAAAVVHGLERARRPAWVRYLAASACLSTPYLPWIPLPLPLPLVEHLPASARPAEAALIVSPLAALCLTWAFAALPGWTRRADRRALALGLGACALCACTQGELAALVLALVGAAVYVLASARATRASSARLALAVVLPLVAFAAWRAPMLHDLDSLSTSTSRDALELPRWPLVLGLPLALLLGARALMPGRRALDPVPERSDLKAALLMLGASAWLGALDRPELALAWIPGLCLTLGLCAPCESPVDSLPGAAQPIESAPGARRPRSSPA